MNEYIDHTLQYLGQNRVTILVIFVIVGFVFALYFGTKHGNEDTPV